MWIMGEGMHVWGRDLREIYLPLRFAVNLKTALKKVKYI